MKRVSLLFTFFFLLSFSSLSFACTLQMEMTGTIGPATVDYIQHGVEVAREKNCSSILVKINTPGGSLQSTRMIVEEILNAPIPFLCLVAPAGGHAGSAGAIILQACHVSGAMRATNIGAATPVAATGEKIPEDLRKKLLNDTISWLEGLTNLRKRSRQFGKEIILNAKAVDAEEALKLGAIDIVVDQVKDFLDESRNRNVELVGGEKGKVQIGPLLSYEPDIRHHLLKLIADPQIAYMMFMGSLGLLYFEITHPGMLVPGVIGGIGLVLSSIALHKLDVWWGGVGLILLGILFLFAEAFVPSFGALGVGGLVAFVTGSILLFDKETTGYSLPMITILPTAIGLGILMLLLAWMAVRTQKLRVHSGKNVFLGKKGEVVELEPSQREGKIDVYGETWKFESPSPVKIGDAVKVKKVSGLTLIVEKKES